MNEEIIKLYEEGFTIGEIVVKLNTVYNRVKSVIDKHEQTKE